VHEPEPPRRLNRFDRVECQRARRLRFRAAGGAHIPANDDRKSAIVLASGVLAAVLTKVVGVIWKGWDGLPG